MFFVIFGALMDAFLLYRILDNFLTFKYAYKYRYIAGYISFAVLILRYVVSLVTSDTSVYYNSKIVTASLIFVLSFVLYKDTIRKKLMACFLFYLTFMISELIVLCILMLVSWGTPFDQVMQSTAVSEFSTIFSRLLVFFMIEQISVKRKVQTLTLSYTKELSFIMVYNIFLFFILLYLLASDTQYMQARSTPLLIVASNVFFVSIISSLLIIKIAQRSKKETEYQLQLQQIEMENKMNNDMASIVFQLRSFRHDMNNHFSVMAGLLNGKQYQQLEDYLCDIIQETSSMNNFIFLENKALTVLINSKLTKAHVKNIEFRTNITVPTLPLSDMDICTLLGNILDNAIEATDKVKENRYIDFALTKRGSQYLIYCENPYVTKPVETNNHFITSKEDSRIHGIGLENIKNVVKKYNGELEINYDTNFEITIMLGE